MKLHGLTSGLAPSQLQALERLYQRHVPFDALTTPELSRTMAEATARTGRQVGVLVDRDGRVNHVIVGDATHIDLPDVGRLRAAGGRLRGLRLLHTHLHNEPLTRDDLVDLTLLRLDMVAAFCLAPSGLFRQVYYGHNVPLDPSGEGEPYAVYGPIAHDQLDVNPKRIVEALEQEFTRAAKAHRTKAKDGRAMLVHVCDKRDAAKAEDSLRELSELARTAGVEVADRVLQVRHRVDPKYVLGRGKLEEVVIRAMQRDVEVLIFDRNLSPAQAAAIAKMTDLKVLDRTQLILDIFAQRAESRDGKLSVELAQTKYLLPRLGAKDDALSRLSGGIGGRGPGETKIEVGKRRANDRITKLKRDLAKLAGQRKQRRRRRQKSRAPIVALVGYTNAGKSTLLNQLTGSDVLAEDALFATLDTRSRRLYLPSAREAVVTDTVGFIRELPKDLFDAFRSTFEEAEDADLLLHCVDASDPSHAEQIRTSERLLLDLGLEHIPRLMVFTKADRLDGGRAEALAAGHGGVALNALDRACRPDLLARMDSMLPG
ncbi:MAG: GTPase HflX [Deltaproteobacteria bacterium]|nr:GTPase HflX [Deltaproteobacteria bacterium]